MESDDDFQLLPQSEEISPSERKLKRLKKAIRVSTEPSSPLLDFPKSEAQDSEELKELSPSGAGSESESEEGFDGGNELDFGLGGEEEEKEEENGLGVKTKRVLEFDSVGDDFVAKRDDPSEEMGDGAEDLRIEEPVKKRRSSDELDENVDNKKTKKKKKKNVDESVVDLDATTKKMTKKERRDNLKQLRAESQRLLRETRDASFKPVLLVQKPISSVLEKIRKRKLEIAKKSVAINSMSFLDDDDDGDDGFVREVVVDCNSGSPIDENRGNGVVKVASEETIEFPVNMKSNLDELCMDEPSDIKDHSSRKSILSQMDVDEESKQEFRAPIGDTQELFSDSQTSDSMDELPSKTPSSPLEEVMAPSILAMNLKLDSAPPDDVSSDEEGNDKENIAPHPHGLTDLSSFHDPVKAFVDDEAEEEDDSDNDMLRFQDNEEDEDNEDLEELKDMIATGYEEKPVDNEKRNQLHQKWLEQQDAAGTENLLQKFNCGSKLKETTLLEEEEDEEGDEYKEDFGDEAAEDSNPTNVARMNLKKAKQMIPQMFTDKDDVYLSSDDEETEKRLAKQCLFEKSEPAMFLSPAEDESSREVFGLIKKLNIVPDSKKKAKTPSLFKMPPVGGKSNILSKSSFLGRGSNHSLPSSQKKASGKVRSFIFGRDDSNSRSSISMSEGSSDAIQRENQPKRPASAKFSNSQTKASTQNTRSVAEMKSGTSLFEILRRSSLQSEQCTRDSMVVQTESVFAAFKLSKKPIKTEGKA
ncbi:uncharacterized protein LOC126712208 isoform X2 [Quercus robur]|uniref:uncharacterized protein LOC126712208 isoform X2 n=1 Tax=Quercus robur TaxID=38942 RepID=UPI0021636576|nr:uncharacterized protein LOC126712208 isoform X2 [Quercus robur]